LRSPEDAGAKAVTKLQVRRQNAVLTQQASSKNRRLLAQMEKRTALNNAAQKIKKKSIKQRLGVQPTFSTRPKLRGSLSQPQRNISAKQSNVKGSTQQTRNQGAVGKITQKSKAAKTSLRGKATGKPVNKPTRGAKQPQKPNTRGRNSVGNVRGRGRRGAANAVANNQQGKTAGQTQRPTRGLPNSRGRGRGRGRGGVRGGGQTPKVSKEDLDKQLDQYMSGTRHTLDQEIDSYMNLGDAEMN